MIGENISDFYDNEIMPYKGLLEEWYVNNKSIIVDMLLIKLTVWVIFFPNSKLVWKVFRTLPSPSKELSRFFWIEYFLLIISYIIQFLVFLFNL